MGKLLLGIAALTLICCLGAFLLGIPVLSAFFGHDLRPYRTALVILILGGGFNAAVMLLYYALTTMRRQILILVCYVISFMCSLFIVPYLVKNYGILGGAFGYTGVMAILVLSFFGCTWYQYRKAMRKEDERKKNDI